MHSIFKLGLTFWLVAFATPSFAGAQQPEQLDPTVRAALQKALSDSASLRLAFTDEEEAQHWIASMSERLQKRIPDEHVRIEFLKTLHYEATRAGLDPQLVLGLTQVESGFRKYAVSVASARGYMQVMPFWLKELGRPGDNLFDMRTNLRFGCTILRHYLNIEKGNLFRALGRYNGSLGRAEYPNLVVAAWRSHWSYKSPFKKKPTLGSRKQRDTAG